MEKISYMGKDTAKQIVGSITGVSAVVEPDYLLAVEDGKIVKTPNPHYDGYYGIEFLRGASDQGGENGYVRMIGTEEALEKMEVHNLIKTVVVNNGKIVQTTENLNFFKDTNGGDVDLSGADGGDIVQALAGSEDVKGVYAIMGGTDETYDRFIVGLKPFVYGGDMAVYVPFYGESVDYSTIVNSQQRCIYDENAAGTMGTQDECILEGFECYTQGNGGFPRTSTTRGNYETYARNKNDDTSKNVPYCNANTLDFSFTLTLMFIECRTKWITKVLGCGISSDVTPSESNWGTVSGARITEADGTVHYYTLGNTALYIDDGTDPTSLAATAEQEEPLFIKRQANNDPEDVSEDDGDVQTLAVASGKNIWAILTGGSTSTGYPMLQIMEAQRDISNGCVEGTFESVVCPDGHPVAGYDDGQMTGIWTKTMNGKILCTFSAEGELAECDLQVVLRVPVWHGRTRTIGGGNIWTNLSGSEVLLYIDEDGNRTNLLFQAKSRDEITTDTSTTNQADINNWPFVPIYENLGDIGSTSGWCTHSIKNAKGMICVHATGTGAGRESYEGAYRYLDTSTTTTGVWIRRYVVVGGSASNTYACVRGAYSNYSVSYSSTSIGSGFSVLFNAK